MANKISIDEMMSRRKDLQSGTATIIKASAPPSWDKDKRSARFIMNAQEVDRYGDIVVTSGIDTTEFEKNPVALLFHNSRSWPVGSWSDVTKVTKGKPPRLEGTLNFLPQGGPVKEVDEAAWMVANGGIRACSIGFMPDWDSAEPIMDEDGEWTYGIKWNKSSLLECSICSVGASPSSLVKDASSPSVAKELLEVILDNWALTPEGLIIPRKEYDAAYRTISAEKTIVEFSFEKDDDGSIRPSIKSVSKEVTGEPDEGAEEPFEDSAEESGEPGECSAEAAPEEGAGGEEMSAEVSEEQKDASLTLTIDASEASAAVKELSAEIDEVGAKAESLMSKLKSLFGFGEHKGTSRIEPEITIEIPEEEKATEPSPEEIESVRGTARKELAAIYAKGLL